MDTHLYIIAGVSCSGKSTFIDQVLVPKILSAKSTSFTADDIAMTFAYRLAKTFNITKRPVTIVHYNSLHAFKNRPEMSVEELRSDPLLKNLLNQPYKTTLYLCYVPEGKLYERVNNREFLEPQFYANNTRYNKELAKEKLQNVNQRKVLLDLADLFSSITSDIHIVLSNENKIDLLSLNDFRYGLPTQSLEQKLK
ncbi:hypothetical protein QGN29_06745 [Temperatibacter marinus]|uniref:Uncharacterized protein n=1 Tax=Temperatibacter marinus TaxID=1456591 RepID=A0AA52HBS9_9PROT|nr:hypothetical protein [Temperatibacter marinus]WND04070.1 hypothetical protein QGN29_06745 [Temperatibacter marinus]